MNDMNMPLLGSASPEDIQLLEDMVIGQAQISAGAVALLELRKRMARVYEEHDQERTRAEERRIAEIKHLKEYRDRVDAALDKANLQVALLQDLAKASDEEKKVLLSAITAAANAVRRALSVQDSDPRGAGRYMQSALAELAKVEPSRNDKKSEEKN